MFVYKNILVSEEIMTARFACNLSVCHGKCCTGGDAGAPLSDTEAEIYKKNDQNFDDFHNIVKEKLIKYGVIEEVYNERLKQKCYCTATDNKKDCVFLTYEKNIAFCYLQKHKTPFVKPDSCYLFPIREKLSNGMIILNMYIYNECRKCYGPDKPLLVEFLADVLKKQYGEDFYDALIEEMKNGK
ncbi:MAG: DUF3109 family protein [Candidatus Wallbacteria bacterium]